MGNVTLKVPAKSNTGTKMRLKGKGVKGGDLLVTLQIVLSDSDADTLSGWAKTPSENEDFNPRAVLL